MKTLIITAHPSEFGFTHKIADQYKKGIEERGSEAEIINLYQKDNQQDFLAFERGNQIVADFSTERMQSKIKAADELVFVFPMWWADAPAVMKNYFDKNFISGFAYHAVNGKVTGLLNGKTASIFATCDAPGIYYTLLLNPTRKIWQYGRLRFCGIKLKNYCLFDRMNKRDERSRQVLLDRVYRLAKG